MSYTDFIVAIDLGTSHIVGMVGAKNSAGVFSILAYEMENSASCIRRGCVYNVEETANKVKRLVRKLENKLNGAKIAKVYVGLGGQSLRSIDHSVVKSLGQDGVVTSEEINALSKECHNYHPDMLDVLSIVSPDYLLDDKQEPNPVGIPCNRIEAHYKLIVGRPSLRRYVINSIKDRAGIEIVDFIVSPLALANAVLSEDEKGLGCALIGFGAGVTSLSVYKNGKLVDLSIIPFGGHLITKDITSLHIVESEAERLKVTYGSAVVNKDSDFPIQLQSSEGMGIREISLGDLNTIIEARVKEIVENVYARLEATGLIDSLGAGIVLSGGSSSLKNLLEVVRERFKMDVRFSSLRKGLVENGTVFANNPEFLVAVGILLEGTENCALYVAPKQEPVSSYVKEDEVQVQTNEQKEVQKVVKSKKTTNIFETFKKRFDNMSKGLFDDEE